MRVRKVTWKAVVQVGLDLANNFGVFICIEHHDPNKMEVPGRRVPAEYIFLSLTPDEKVFRRLIAARHAEECNGLREEHAWPVARDRPRRPACGRSRSVGRGRLRQGLHVMPHFFITLLDS